MSNLRTTATSLVKRTSFSAAVITPPLEPPHQPQSQFPATHHPPQSTGKKLEKSHEINNHSSETIKNANVRSYDEVPGPWGLPFIGNSWRFAPLIGHYKISDLDKVMKELHINYGKIAKVGGLIGHPDLLFVFDGDEIRNIFKKEEAMPHRPSMPSLRRYKGVLRKDFFGDVAGLIGVHGKSWETFRQEVQQILLQPQTAKKYIPPLNDIASEFMVRIHEMRDENNELPGNFLHELYKWALESVGRVALDTRLGCLSPQGNEESQKIINCINTFFWAVPELELRMPVWRFYPTKAYRSFIKALDDFTEICMKNISRTMDAADSCTNLNRAEADISIVERIVRKTGNRKLAAVLALDLFLVGVDTTSVAVSSTIYQLAKNPEKQQKLFQELQKVFPSTHEAEINQNVLEQIPYLRACVKETLRMYPVVIANGRSLQSDAIINGYHIPKGTNVIFPHLVVSNDPAYFPQPKSFQPERWLKQTETQQQQNGNPNANRCPHDGHKIHPFVSLPFGYGRRMCVGRRFAEIELHTLLAKIFRKYKVEYNHGELEYKVNSTYIPESPLNFKLTVREE
ncbi:probable cytochrome P450 49a1 isoform X2 [Musca domestica]|uniref:Probable cytochrome P450 49a1 isoform X2 n=1 Tax=Musca domestica TaxID=7370 RepID=A0A1I8MIX8_MUSDO|nr:probable cytochrome P450 49a1 isoform X2 [Musca domestica]